MGHNSDDIRYDVDQDTLRIIFAAYLGLYVVIVVPLVIMFIKRSNVFPIAGRVPYLVLLCNVVQLILAAGNSLQIMFLQDFPCDLWYFIRLFCNVFICLAYTARCLVLVFKFEHTIEQLNASGYGDGPAALTTSSSTSSLNPSDKSARRGWYMRHVHWIRPRNVLLMLLASIVVFSAPGVALYFVQDVKRDEGVCIHSYGALYIGAFLLFSAITYVRIWLKLREVTEGYHIKPELRTTVAIAIIFGIIWGVGLTVDVFPIAHAAVNLAMLSLVLNSLGFPLYLTGSTQSKPPPAPEDVSTLESLLAHKEGRDSFRRHLCREFNLENLIILEEIEKFKAAVSEMHKSKAKRRTLSALIKPKRADAEHEPLTEDDILIDLDTNKAAWKKAFEVYAKCIREGAPYEVNISHDDRQKIAKQIKNAKERMGEVDNEYSISQGPAPLAESSSGTDVKMDVIDGILPIIYPDFFDEVRDVMMRLIKRDTYQRYVAGPYYARLIDGLQRANQAQEKFEKVEEAIAESSNAN